MKLLKGDIALSYTVIVKTFERARTHTNISKSDAENEIIINVKRKPTYRIDSYHGKQNGIS